MVAFFYRGHSVFMEYSKALSCYNEFVKNGEPCRIETLYGRTIHEYRRISHEED